MSSCAVAPPAAGDAVVPVADTTVADARDADTTGLNAVAVEVAAAARELQSRPDQVISLGSGTFVWTNVPLPSEIT